MSERSATVESLRAVVNANADGMVVVDDYGVICYANPAAQRLFGRDHAELAGHFFGFPVKAGDVTEIGIFRDGQPLTVEMRVTSIVWEGEPAHLAALRDVTDRKRAEDTLRAAVDLRDDVIAIVGHDLRAPLAVVIAGTRTLLDEDGGVPDPDHREILTQVKRQAWQMNRVVESLLTLSRLEGDRLEVDRRPTDVRAVVTAVADDLRDAGIDADVAIEVPEGTTVDADESHLRLILTNFLTNAVKYGAPPIAVQARPGGATVEIVVSDHGEGVPEEFVPHLFQRFRRASASAGEVSGTGLGLAVARRLAEAGGGSVHYERNHPTGACFVVRLPRAVA